MEPIIPNDFKARYSKILGRENKIFLDYCRKPLRKSIRINTLKVPKDVLSRLEHKGYSFQRIPWYKFGYWFEGEAIGNTLEHFLGYIYVQEAVSMVPPLVLEPKEDDCVLDVCAAPGSKTTQVSEIMQNRGIIVANDNDYTRLKALKANLERLGCMNIIVTYMNGLEFSRFKETFDKILLDAPCSSEGAVRKNWNILSAWNLKMIRRLSNIQKQLISACIKALKPDGVLVYSTCTLSPEENEDVVEYALRHFDVKLEKIKINGLKTREGLTESTKPCIRIWPQDNNTEGFFIAKLVKL